MFLVCVTHRFFSDGPLSCRCSVSGVGSSWGACRGFGRGGGVRALSLGPCVWPAVIRGIFGPGAGFRVGWGTMGGLISVFVFPSILRS